VLNDDELKIVWATANDQGTFGKLIQFLLLVGCRRSEATGLTWAEINEAGEWRLPPERSKTAQELVRPLSKAALEVLGDRGDPADLCFLGVSGLSWAKECFDKACGVTGWTLHDCRRSFRTLCSRAGIPSEIAERLLGHTPGNKIEQTYDRHSYAEEKARAYETLSRYIAGILNPSPRPSVVTLRRRVASDA
jgi:integrase